MPVFCIQLSRVVTDMLRASVTIQAATQADAERFALANASEFSFEYTQQIDSTPPDIDAVSPVLMSTTRPDFIAPGDHGAPPQYRLELDRWRDPIGKRLGEIIRIRLLADDGTLLDCVDDDNDDALMSGLILDAVALAGEEIPAGNHGHPQILPRFIAAVMLGSLGISPCDPEGLEVTCNED